MFGSHRKTLGKENRNLALSLGGKSKLGDIWRQGDRERVGLAVTFPKVGKKSSCRRSKGKPRGWRCSG